MAGLSPTDAHALVQGGIELAAATGLSAARALGIMLVLPVFTRPRISGLIRGSLTIAIGLPCLPQIKLGLEALDPNTRLVSVAMLGLKEVFVGLLLGILLSIPLWSIQRSATSSIPSEESRARLRQKILQRTARRREPGFFSVSLRSRSSFWSAAFRPW